MAPLRFIHCADLHLDRPFQGLRDIPPSIADRIRESTFRSFHRIIDAAIEHSVDFIVIAGDLFDEENRSLRAQARFRDEMERLDSRGIMVYAIHGNHDPLDGRWVPLSLPENVHIFGPEVEMIPYDKKGETLAHLYGFSYRERAVPDNRSPFYKKILGAPYHIGILHGQEEGSGSDHAAYAPFTVRELLTKEFDYWALGHIHKRKMLHEEPVILYPGNIQGLNPKETGEKGCVLIEMDERRVRHTFLPTSDVEWQACEISVTGAEDAGHFLEILESRLETLRKRDAAVLVVLQVIGTGPLHSYLLDENHVEDLLFALREGECDRRNFVWPVSVKRTTMPEWNRDELKKENHFIGDLLRLIDGEGTDEALRPLWENRRAKRFLDRMGEEEESELMKEAEHLLLGELLRKGEQA